MEDVNNMAFSDLINLTNEIANDFFIAKRLHDIKNEDSLAESAFDEDYPYDQYLLKVKRAYDSLTVNEQNLINNEFFYQSYHQWWRPIYSKATFYRHKKEAMKKFIGAFYE